MRASVQRIYGFSGHADRLGLLSWSENFQVPPRKVFLTHGDEEAVMELAAELRKRPDWSVAVPHYESVYDLR